GLHFHALDAPGAGVRFGRRDPEVEEADAGGGLPGDVEGLRLDVAVARLVDARVVRADHDDLVEPLRPAQVVVADRHDLTSLVSKTMSPIIPRWPANTACGPRDKPLSGSVRRPTGSEPRERTASQFNAAGVVVCLSEYNATFFPKRLTKKSAGRGSDL